MPETLSWSMAGLEWLPLQITDFNVLPLGQMMKHIFVPANVKFSPIWYFQEMNDIYNMAM